MGNGGSSLTDGERNDFKKIYNISEDKMKLIIKSFKKQAKNDRITREKFVEIMAKHGVMDAELSTQVFDSFDRDHSNSMDVREYMALMGVTFGGSMDQKLKASFEIFDRNGDGSLSKDEVRQMLTMVVRQVTRAQLKAKTKNVSGATPIEIDEAAAAKIEEILNQIFEKIDTDKSGSIDVNEFIKGFSEHPDICGFFKQF
eukprot:TRINITY_DN15373_c0_g1_i1.p1 TRINITY_DN15373_c0_g1~~TRINITY_DN15373_c0_g1_i1.p1  ORF type:complete len:212 (+),score=73.56 TRINITY_DN15373_c0_g1_i1:38-637(+)